MNTWIYWNYPKYKAQKIRGGKRICPGYTRALKTHVEGASKTPTPRNSVVEWFSGRKKKIIITSAITAIVSLTISLIVFLFVPYEKNIEVEMFSWERSIAVEELKTFNESGWTLPSEARLQRTALKMRTSDNLIDKKYYYEIDRWTQTRTVTTAGAGTSCDPYWGEVVLGHKEREGQRTESYYVHAKDGETYSVELQDWQKLEVGSFITVSVRRIDNKIVDSEIDFSEQ